MAEYKIFFKESVWKDLRKISKSDLIRIMARIEKLGDDPRPNDCEKLTGEAHFRVRQGKYRIVYSVQDKELQVWVIKVGHRKDVYR